MINFINRILYKFNWSLVPAEKAKQWIVDEMEIAELENDLRNFAARYPACIGKEAKGEVNWSDIVQTRSYLDNSRIAFFHQVIKTAESNGIKFENKKILDVGSGTGYLLRLIKKTAPSSTLAGYDTYPELLQLSRFLCPGVMFYDKSIFSEFDSDYDLVLCTETLEHLVHPDQALNNCFKFLRKNGSVFITVPDGRKDTFDSVGKYPDGKGYWGHINFWSIESWEVFLSKVCTGCEIKVGKIDGHQSLYGLVNAK